MTTPAPAPVPEFRPRDLPEAGKGSLADPNLLVMVAGRAHGGLARVRDHRRSFIAVTDLGLIREVLLSRQANYRRANGFGKPLLGESLLTTAGSDWQRRRRKMGSLFRFDKLDTLAPLVREETSRALDRWAELARAGEPLNIAEEAYLMVIRTLTAAIFSSMDVEERERLGWAIVEGLRQTHRRNEDLFHLPRAIPTPQNRRLTRTMQSVDGIIRGEIERRRAISDDHPRDLLRAMFAVRDPESGATMDDAAILEEIRALLAAGIDTTAAVLSRTLELVSTSKDVAFSWHAEVDYQLHGRAPERRDLDRLTRLTQIVNETLRLYPPVPTISRECIVPDVLGGHEIAAGTRLQLSVLAVHRDERFWADPDEFRPGRFARDWPRHAHLPFGLGQHACVASNFALTQLLSMLALIGQRFRFEVTAEDASAKESHHRREEGAAGPMLRVISRS